MAGAREHPAEGGLLVNGGEACFRVCHQCLGAVALYFKKCACRYVYVALWHYVLLRTVAHCVALVLFEGTGPQLSPCEQGDHPRPRPLVRPPVLQLQ